MIIIFTIKSISIKVKKTLAVVCAAAAVLCAGTGSFVIGTDITAGAYTTSIGTRRVASPQLQHVDSTADTITLKIGNLRNYSNSAVVRIYVGSTFVKNVSVRSLKRNNLITIDNDGRYYFRPNTSYRVKACVYECNSTSVYSIPMILKTESKTDYKLNKSTRYYKLSGGRMTAAGSMKNATVANGVRTSSNGTKVSGKSIKTYNNSYILLNDGEYKGSYVKADNTVKPLDADEAKVEKVVLYAMSMDGGSYVWGGESYRATDCSGLIMLAYAQVGIKLPHNAAAQASYGTASSMSSLKPGDIIICSGYGHVAMYIGDNKIVHALNSRDGIKIQPISQLNYFGGINAVRRII